LAPGLRRLRDGTRQGRGLSPALDDDGLVRSLGRNVDYLLQGGGTGAECDRRDTTSLGALSPDLGFS
jgi:hypothetical protein